MTSITVGNISAISRPVPRPTSRMALFASAKRAASWSSRTNARITRMPVICSRRTRLIVSIRTCIVRNSGRIFRMINVTEHDQDRHDDEQQPRQRHVLPERHDDAAEAHDRRQRPSA